MAEAVVPRRFPVQMAGVVAGTVVVLNGLFWLLSARYVTDKGSLSEGPIDLGALRFAFAAMSLIVGSLAVAAGWLPRVVGYGLTVLVAVGCLVGGIAAAVTDLPAVMAVTMLVLGVILPGLVWQSVAHSRAAWSFLVAVLSVLATVTFFGAPKIRNVLDIGLWYTMIIPGVLTVAVVALSMLRREYRDHA